MAEQTKFALEMVETDDRLEFQFEDDALSFSTVGPNQFVWNDLRETLDDFAAFNLFADVKGHYIGYEPRNRDQFSVRIYSAGIIPEREALAADYARAFASHWGRTNFGVQAHSPDFGEVLGGDETTGIKVVTRISVLKRGDTLIIVRTEFQAEHFDRYETDIARLIGSIRFDTQAIAPLPSSPTQTAFPNGQGAIDYSMPVNWTKLALASPMPRLGQIDLWVDAADPQRNGALMVTIMDVDPEAPLNPAAPDQQRLANLAGTFSAVALQNLLGTDQISLEPQSLTPFEQTGRAAFQGNFAFKATVEGSPTPISVSTFIASGEPNTVQAVTKIAPWPNSSALAGTNMHVTFAASSPMNAMRRFWADQ